MARRLMSRRRGSASQPQVTPYQQLELDDGWREWENTKQELVQVKRLLTEKDAMIVQLKTASRRLQETLRKKDKDLQAAFAILRSPQNAKTTKTRKQELIDRLVSECMQRAATSEALAEERRQELDRMKFSSKFLRFQELEVEIEECHREIERLRIKLETTSAPSPTTVIAGKLKLSSVPLPTNGSGTFTGTLVKKTKLDPLNLFGDKSLESRQPMDSKPIKMYSSQSTVGQVRVVAPAKYDHREGFVSKTRRRALEAEYYKQVRLAQLEVECELEENLHIRAAREAKRLEAIEHQVKQTELFIDSARSQQEDLNIVVRNNESRKVSSINGVEPSTGHHSSVHADAEPINSVLEQSTRQQIGEPESNSDMTEKKSLQQEVDRCAGLSVKNSVQTGYIKEIAPEEPEVQTAPNVKSNKDDEEHGKANVNVLPKQKTYDDEEFDASDDSTTGNSKGKDLGTVEQSVWNADPNPKNDYKPDEYESSDSKRDQPISINTDDGYSKSVLWNADPNPANSIESASPSESGTHIDRVVWNVDPHAVGSDVSMDDASVIDRLDEDDDHDVVLPEEDLVGNVWNTDPTPSVLTDGIYVHAEASAVQNAVQEAGSSVLDDVGARKIWNLDPDPLSEPAHTTSITEVDNSEHSVENEHPVWNLNPVTSLDPTPTTTSTTKVDDAECEYPIWNVVPESAVEATSSPDSHSSKEKLLADITEKSYDGNVGADPNNQVDPNPSDTTTVVDPPTDRETGASPWNLEPNTSPSHSVNDNGGDYDTPTQNANLSVQVLKEGGEFIANRINAQLEPDHDPTDNEAGTNNVWNLDPRGPMIDYAGSSSPGDEKSVWNLDPHAGDTSEPSNIATSPRSVHEGDVAATAATDKHQREVGEHTTTHSSPLESEDNMDEATPEYTPPSTARDSDVGYDDDT